MTVLRVVANNRRKAFEVHTRRGIFALPFAKLEIQPTPRNRVRHAWPDEELGQEGFSYTLQSGEQATVPLDAVLDYNRDPSYLHELLLHGLTVQAISAVGESALSKRELIRGLRTSPSQFYRLLDPTYYGKSVGQMLALLHLLGKQVDLVVHDPARTV